jgi:hypothetical protein
VRLVDAARSLCWLALYLKKFGLFLNTPRMFTSCKQYGGSKSQRKVANSPSKIWQSLNIREHHVQISLGYTKKFKSILIRGMLVITRERYFVLLSKI